jgi:hypothetical protein
MTDHMNTDKLHNYLNAGLEVVASPIPAARRLARSGGEWATLLNDLGTDPLADSWPREANTWNRRWGPNSSIWFCLTRQRRQRLRSTGGLRADNRGSLFNAFRRFDVGAPRAGLLSV